MEKEIEEPICFMPDDRAPRLDGSPQCFLGGEAIFHHGHYAV